jgi:ribosome-associated heat shock protein Hsp15
VERVRIDRWLSAARVFKSRTRAQEACTGGLVKINGSGGVKPSDWISVGDEVRVQAPGGLRVLGVLALAESRLPPPRARALYEDRTPPELSIDSRLLKPVRDRGAGRPTKRERRQLDRLRRG